MKSITELRYSKQIKTIDYNEFGASFSKKINNDKMIIIASNAMGWDHVSVSFKDRCPTWNEMCMVKDLFFNDDETVIQYHPMKSEYINNHPYCLHLWINQSKDIELPPTILV